MAKQSKHKATASIQEHSDSVELLYVSDMEPGITRLKKGKGFVYLFDNEKVNDAEHLYRIKSLVIPPAWTNVWICRHANGHLQATGFDTKNRKQYKYHIKWNELRNHTKFHRLRDFASALPLLRQKIEKDLALPGMPPQKVLALVLSLMELTSIRIGNSSYEKLYGSFGLTTLKDRHVKINGATLQFFFKGKKGVQHSINIKSRRLAAMVKKCRDIPGKELFQYIDENGNHHCIDSGMVNNYIKETGGFGFSAKDFRTWTGCVHALDAFKELGVAETKTETKKNIVEVLDRVSAHLGNTRTVCKKYYVHPLILNLYEDQRLNAFFDSEEKTEAQENGLTSIEKMLVSILETENEIAAKELQIAEELVKMAQAQHEVLT